MLEELDARIAAVLAADGRCSYTDLAERVGLSVSAVHQRVRRLEKRGVIRGYSAQIDCEQIGLPLTAFVSLTPIDPAAPDDYPQRLAGHVGDRGLPFGRRRGVVHRQGAGRVARRPWRRCWRRSGPRAGLSTRTTVVLSTPYENRPVTPPAVVGDDSAGVPNAGVGDE